MKKLLSLILALALVLSMAACGGSNETTTTASQATSGSTESSSEDDKTDEATEPEESSSEEGEDDAHEDDEYWELYNSVLGEYYENLQAANETEDVSERYALQAIAEAKLLESGVFLPTTTQGGNYAISRVAPRTVSSAMFGTDDARYQYVVIASEFIKKADRDELNKLYSELVGTGTYREEAIKYLKNAGYEIKDTYSLGYSSEPKTWDLLNTYRAADSEAIVNTQDNLVYFDNEGEMQMAVADSYEVNEDGTEYTFKLKEGIKWVTSSGEEYAELTAQDFVDGFQHLLDAAGGLESLTFGVIKNAEEYTNGEVDFSEVGVEAVDTYTLKYTLAGYIPYFTTMLTYNLFVPMNKEYFEAEGDDYGTTPDDILYYGAYLVSNHTENNKIVFSLNPTYYDAENVLIKEITWNYNDGSDVTKAYNDAKSGVIDGAGLNTTTVEQAKNDKLFDDYAYISSTNATSYCAFINVDREAYATEGYTLDSPKTEDQQAATKTALANQNFRQAILFSIDRAVYNGVSVGEDLALVSLRNTYTPGRFVALTDDITVDINGTATSFAAGTNYGEIIQAQLTADGSSIVVWDPEGDDGLGSTDGFDGWFNKEAANEKLDAAIEELKAEGLEISAENPIYIDYPYYVTAVREARANALKQGIEDVLGGKVIVNLIPTEDIYGIYYAGYYCDYGYECNYDIYDISGWGPDYGDPQTYLNTMLPEYNGDMTHCLGMY